MKSVLVFFICFITATQAPISNLTRAKGYQLECIEETKVNANLVIRFNSGSFWENHHPRLKKWVLCVLMKLELMSAQGVFQLDVALQRLPDEDKFDAENLIDECLSTRELPPAEIAWTYIKCLHQKDGAGRFPTITIFIYDN